jgi:hypothetical protein
MHEPAFGTLEVKALLHEMLRTFSWSIPDTYAAGRDHTRFRSRWTGFRSG